MFHLYDKKIIIASPVNGTVEALDQVNDAVFSSRKVGDGCAILPNSNLICAPCNGKIVQIIETNHAFCIISDDGLEILVHIGIDTLQLKGTGFRRLIEEGMMVKTGEPIMKVNFSYLKERGKDTTVTILITNMEQVRSIKTYRGNVNVSDRLMQVKMK